MKAVELRTLDGPNLFMMRPAIKIELQAETDEPVCLATSLAERVGLAEHAASGPVAIARLTGKVIAWIARESGMAPPAIAIRDMEDAGHAVVAFSWERRGAARAVARLAWNLVSGEARDPDHELAEIRALLAAAPDADDLPEMIADADRTVPTIGITGTNGKTTTTRLISSILRTAGNSVAWTSSAGVVVDGEMVLPGDYTGPAGAQRVFDEPGIDFAVLETARGGILLRGLGYEHSDVGVMTNISADHMGLHGVHSLETLTEVKSVVVRATKPDGVVVLNADDPRVLGLREVVEARTLLFSRDAGNEDVGTHISGGGWALVVRDGTMVWHHGGIVETVVSLGAVPMTFGGRAQHMVENALAAAAACLAIGLSPAQVGEGLAAFRNTSEQNRGRLNVYRVGDVTVVIDFAHNEAGLDHLLRFARSFCEHAGRVLVVVGTAGDRDDDALRGIATIARERSDGVVLKDTEKYLRGRASGEMPALMRQFVGDALLADVPGEWAGFVKGLELAVPGDVLAVMCIEESDRILEWLDANGQPL